MKFRQALLVVILIFAAAITYPTRPAEAACTFCCSCDTIRNYIITEITNHETWMTDTFWSKLLEPELAQMTNRIDESLLTQTTSIGTFLDAQNNVERARMLQESRADAAIDFAPSEQLCRYGSLGQSLASSEAKMRANKQALVKRSLNRQLGDPNMASSTSDGDVTARMAKFVVRYCDNTDNNGKNGKMKLCKTATGDKFLNADIDYVKTFDSKPTLNADFTESKNAPSDDEQDLLALSDNLFANDLMGRPATGELQTGEQISNARTAYMDMRALIAKRSVAENSFNTLAAMKLRGTDPGTTGSKGSTPYIISVLKELGVDSDASIKDYLGGAPSYDAQMEVLTKKIYQNPAFYVNLMENPANVQRQYAAMQSFGLMQQRDIFDSILRSEMLLSLIVELEVGKYQDEAQALLDKTK